MFTIADSIGIKLVSANCLLVGKFDIPLNHSIAIIQIIRSLPGIGNELQQYRIKSPNETHHTQLNLNFKSKIYGFHCLSDASSEEPSPFVIVYGGKELAILTNVGQSDVKIVQCLALSDWCSTAHVYETHEATSIRFCALTSHSCAMEIEANSSGAWNIVNRSASVDKSTLYCSRIIGRKWSTTIVFGGTALGELIIWSVKSDDFVRQVIHRVSGHNVSIDRSHWLRVKEFNRFRSFQGVIFSIECDLRHNLLTTTSDDRSVKVWTMNFSDEQQDWHTSTLTSSKSMFGHTARIFAHKIIEFNGAPYIVSIGEDANVCLWTSEGQLVHRELVDGGKSSLWNLDWDPIRQYLVTCGSDGNINQIPFEDILNCNVSKVDVMPAIDNEHFAKIRVMHQCNLLITSTAQNKLFYRRIEDAVSQWRCVNDDSCYKSTLLEVHGSMVATAGYKRATIYQFNGEEFEKLLDENLTNGMIRSLKFLDNDSFVVCDDKGNATFCTLNNDVKLDFSLPTCKERWMTVAHRCGKYLIVGDRSGNLHLYIIDGQRIELKNTLRQVHGILGCTSIYQNAKPSNGRIEFQTSGHDGTVKSLHLDEEHQTIAVQFTHRIPIAWTGRIISLGNEERIIAGFNDNHFIAVRSKGVWGSTIHFEYECGGGHRYSDVYVDNRESQLNCHFYYIRTKQLHRVQFRLDRRSHPFDIVHLHWHHRPCNAVRHVRLRDDRELLVSAGDDNLLKFHSIGAATKLCHLVDVTSHISNIKTICVVAPPSADGWLVFSAGGRAQICVTGLIVRGTSDSIEFRERVDFMLRLNDVQRKRLGKSRNIDLDPETRFMSIFACVNDASHGTWWLIVACSDGFIRRFVYDDRASTIVFDAAVFYGRCILHVHQLQLSDNSDDHVLLSMATDGRICFWPLNAFTAASKPFFELHHHDSGINSFDILIESDSSIWIATGGDDQAVVISRMKLPKRDQVIVEETHRFPHTHTAQVNGIRFNRLERAMYSLSVDQKIFRYDLMDLSAHEVVYTCVSDAKGLQVINDQYFLAFGCGVQLLEIPLKQKSN